MGIWLWFSVALVPSAGPEPVTISVSPAPAPAPALTLTLLPKPRDRVPGNAAVGYYQAALLRPAGPRDPAKARTAADQEEAFRTKPIESLSVRELHEFLKPYQTMFRTVDEAALRDRCDWQREGQLSPEGLFTLLPDLQQHRDVARMLQLRVRLHAADRKFDDAVSALRSGLQQAKHIGEGPSLIALMVGLSLANEMMDRVDDLIQRPGSPNLYWALTTLPRPLIDPRTGLDGEEGFLAAVVPGLKTIEKKAVSADQASQSLEAVVKALTATADDIPDPGIASLRTKVGTTGYAALYADQARKELQARGRSASEVEALPAAQAVLLRALAVARELQDDHIKLFSLPYPDAAAGLDKLRERIRQIKAEANDPLVLLFTLNQPAVDRVYASFARLERRLAFLKTLEAIRLHAAAKNGEPPPTLQSIVTVPVPVDPVTGRPFLYSRNGTSFVLQGEPPPGEAATVTNSLHYAITIRK